MQKLLNFIASHWEIIAVVTSFILLPIIIKKILWLGPKKVDLPLGLFYGIACLVILLWFSITKWVPWHKFRFHWLMVAIPIGIVAIYLTSKARWKRPSVRISLKPLWWISTVVFILILLWIFPKTRAFMVNAWYETFASKKAKGRWIENNATVIYPLTDSFIEMVPQKEYHIEVAQNQYPGLWPCVEGSDTVTFTCTTRRGAEKMLVWNDNGERKQKWLTAQKPPTIGTFSYTVDKKTVAKIATQVPE